MKTRLLLFLGFFSALAVRTACAVPGDLFVSINGTSNSTGSISQYTPAGMQSTFASGLNTPRGLAFDSAGDLFVDNSNFDAASHTLQGTVLKFSSGGTQSTFASSFPTNFLLQGMAIDKSGDVFVSAGITSPTLLSFTIFKITPSGTESTFFSSSTQLFGLAFDHAGNLFATSNTITGASQVLEFTPGGTQSTFVTASSNTLGFAGLAFDSAGNLFVAAGSGTPGTDTILKFTASGVQSTFASGLNGPRGLAFDSTGNLFVAEFTTPTTGDILKFTSTGAESVFASGVTGPTWLAVQPTTATVPEASSTCTLLLLGLATTFAPKIFVRRRA